MGYSGRIRFQMGDMSEHEEWLEEPTARRPGRSPAGAAGPSVQVAILYLVSCLRSTIILYIGLGYEIILWTDHSTCLVRIIFFVVIFLVQRCS